MGRALPRAPIPADLLARQALHDAAAEAAAAAGPAAPNCLEACCLRDDLHLFMCVGWLLQFLHALLLFCTHLLLAFPLRSPACHPTTGFCRPAGPTRSLLTWARLPLPLLYEGGQVVAAADGNVGAGSAAAQRLGVGVHAPACSYHSSPSPSRCPAVQLPAVPGRPASAPDAAGAQRVRHAQRLLAVPRRFCVVMRRLLPNCISMLICPSGCFLSAAGARRWAGTRACGTQTCLCWRPDQASSRVGSASPSGTVQCLRT